MPRSGPTTPPATTRCARLYDGRRGAGMSRSAPRVARWLGDIRAYFPSSVVQVMQADAMQRLGLDQAAAGARA
ncbi:hypothetical protein GCM10025868_14950 [Angustibacter aerolatus]|uniref:Uncharacterized protein n=1 Tax=Angustibacter aerolatus TaxID=1162965 RepID=A0ABQ6JHC7_9ACTN|nr:hypothetical protein GCM10025868_14950 [Angustibacter aerolatus]